MSDQRDRNSAGPARIGIISAWASRLGGGVFEAVVAHCELVRAAGFEPVVIALRDQHSAADRARFGDTEVHTVPVIGPAMIGYAPALAGVLTDARLDLLHLHGIWMYPSAAASRWRARTGLPYLISPHGMADPWIVSRGKRKKFIARASYERMSWKRASAFHALTEAEAEDIRTEMDRDEIAVIPNAMDITEGAAVREPVAVYLGRIHPKKNIEGLIEGWIQARDVLAAVGARLKIAGWGDAEQIAALRRQIAAAGDSDIEFLGPVYGEAKGALIGNASFVVLPSHSEGLPVAILEAWAAGTPTIMSQHCHLPEGFSWKAALDSGTAASDIADALRRGFSLSEEARRTMGAASSALVCDKFTSGIVVGHWHKLYTSLLKEGKI